jgi:hypothetical protein
MNKNLIFPMVLALGLSACGKSMHMVAQSGQSGPASDAVLKNAVRAAGAGEAVKTDAIDGSLSPLSIEDLKSESLKSALPYLNAESKEGALRNLGIPSLLIKTKDAEGKEIKLGAVKRSNLGMRAVIQLPPQESITAVKKLQLSLRGVRVHSTAGEVKNLGQATVCFVDAKLCFGANPSKVISEKANLNAEFASNYKIVESEMLSKVEGLSLLTELNANEKVLELKGKDGSDQEVVLDLISALSLDEKSAIEFVKSAFVDYSKTEEGFKKIRIVIGNGIYVSEGKLAVEFDVDGAKIPEGYAKSKTSPKAGAQDQVAGLSGEKFLVTEVELKKAEVSETNSQPVSDISSNSESTALGQTPVEKAIAVSADSNEWKNSAAELKKADAVIEKVLLVSNGTPNEAELKKYKEVLVSEGLNEEKVLIKTDDASSIAGAQLRVELKLPEGEDADSGQKEVDLAADALNQLKLTQ